MDTEGLVLSVSDFVAVFNQTIEFAYPSVTIQGELANFRVNKNRWVYFDIKDEMASVRCFGTVFQLPGPLEDGMLLQVRAVPRLHPQFGFSLTVQTIQPTGEGSIKKAAALLEAKLRAEGLFDEDRKRPLPYPPTKIGLITSTESAAYADFVKILNARWGGVDVFVSDVQVQGESAPAQIVAAFERLNQHDPQLGAIVLIRGGGSADDLAAFSTDQVTRAVAASRVPTIVAIGHEIDVSLAELAADKRASTPSNAAELLVPDRKHEQRQLAVVGERLARSLVTVAKHAEQQLQQQTTLLHQRVVRVVEVHRENLGTKRRLIEAFSPRAALARGFAIVRSEQQYIKTGLQLSQGAIVEIEFVDSIVSAKVQTVNELKEQP